MVLAVDNKSDPEERNQVFPLPFWNIWRAQRPTAETGPVESASIICKHAFENQTPLNFRCNRIPKNSSAQRSLSRISKFGEIS
jgi:hypothetical protein